MTFNNTVSLERPCDGCRMRPGPHKCVQCHSSWYCSKECQKVAWREHKRVCKEKVEDALSASAIVGSPNDNEIPQFHPRSLTEENNHLFDHFLALAKQEPFYSHARDLRDVIQEEDKKRPKKRPTVEGDKASMLMSRKQYTELVREKGSAEQKELWSKLCGDSREEYVARVYATPLLGGIYAKTATALEAERSHDGQAIMWYN
mmetsp:Transcript_9713/g.27221  ORF Transcript_9713/g.27221 Transcript_9713/m.27221 type:complete len:203 (-) Transcript_9713:640-1248(-)|eukprot:CAMPEP_0181021870 /NCGR_PEP_ID=MMETSP1070-20121207/1213_1 /TAXON_ID=265543 /ORGANISM="Minutocellus polymorphus, Strain NH13" /LENGTH=202 /DNA_ID=CAMNT_0023098777 /DNA_START=151 /DNA_END=759 /DNA_ORIENTATION=+